MFFLPLQQLIGLYSQHLAIGVHRQQLEKFMSNKYQIGENALMTGTHKAMSNNFGQIMSEHIGHEDIGILAIRHIHGVGHQIDYIQVGAEQFDSSIE